MPDPGDISLLVNSVFAAWNEAGLGFLVLRNYENLPRSTTNDIDVLIEHGCLSRAEQLLRTAAAQAGFLLLNRAEFATNAFYFAHRESGQSAHFDLFTGLRWRGFDFIAADELLRCRVPRQQFATPHPAHEAAVNLLATFVFSGRVKEKYRAGIAAQFLADPARARALLELTCGPQLAARLVELGAAARWADIESLIGLIRRQLIRHQLFHRPLDTLRSLSEDMWRLLKRAFYPPGMVIALIGADGCGKSTVQPQLIEQLASEFSPTKGAQFHWKPPVFSGARQAARQPTTAPHAQPPRPVPLALGFFALHWLEFFLGYFLRVRPVTFRGGFVVIDRFYYDFFVDPRRYRMNLPRSLVQLGYILLPKPDVVFLLDAPAEVLQSRKREVPFAETARQCQAYQDLIRQMPNGILVDATQPPPQMAAKMRRAILEFLVLRSLNRDVSDWQ
jgi:thymidylate kinase